ncbi:hypothetical protein SJAG_04947 [Schizosaccharomyces japonicus yFS275]|uniref:Uncharacterized protein n=1 Tax=Schizosaccharomyces japonicus (strain yFS275 / FY16936) TaxID=402676 RepID=B6K869_SCHJY|nr:hypothetical protein SJAG_04947 [Schizosaccharomyces japonicus yFS275]EEB09723.1 hypothetical protein SJAG_04947 [Schizosaccharomyces japonicus yFS275]
MQTYQTENVRGLNDYIGGMNDYSISAFTRKRSVSQPKPESASQPDEYELDRRRWSTWNDLDEESTLNNRSRRTSATRSQTRSRLHQIEELKETLPSLDRHRRENQRRTVSSGSEEETPEIPLKSARRHGSRNRRDDSFARNPNRISFVDNDQVLEVDPARFISDVGDALTHQDSRFSDEPEGFTSSLNDASYEPVYTGTTLPNATGPGILAKTRRSLDAVSRLPPDPYLTNDIKRTRSVGRNVSTPRLQEPEESYRDALSKQPQQEQQTKGKQTSKVCAAVHDGFSLHKKHILNALRKRSMEMENPREELQLGSSSPVRSTAHQRNSSQFENASFRTVPPEQPPEEPMPVVKNVPDNDDHWQRVYRNSLLINPDREMEPRRAIVADDTDSESSYRRIRNQYLSRANTVHSPRLRSYGTSGVGTAHPPSSNRTGLTRDARNSLRPQSMVYEKLHIRNSNPSLIAVPYQSVATPNPPVTKQKALSASQKSGMEKKHRNFIRRFFHKLKRLFK